MILFFPFIVTMQNKCFIAIVCEEGRKNTVEEDKMHPINGLKCILSISSTLRQGTSQDLSKLEDCKGKQLYRKNKILLIKDNFI